MISVIITFLNGAYRPILQLKDKQHKIFKMHSTGFEPVMFLRKPDYESRAFDHSATNA